MEKPLMHSKDMVASNIDAIAALFPNCVTERKDANGKVVRGIDFEKLQQELSNDIIERGEERYQFTWPGKMAAIREANTPTNSALRPDVEGSEDFWNTKNLYIEGDNLEVLKLLQEDYLGKVKMIYIDPPYNTGNDFVYNDDFAESSADFSAKAGMYDENGNMLLQNYEKNSESKGRFHTDWLNMMYPRLKVARNLLTEDGVIFISIDDNEVENLRKVCDEIFGNKNFVATFPWRKRTAKSDVPFGVSQDYEWVLCYSKSGLFEAGVEGNERKYYETPDFPGRPWRFHDLTKQTTAAERPNSYFTIVNPKNGMKYPANPNATWRITVDTIEDYLKANRIIFPGDYDFLRISKPVLRYWKEDDIKKAGDKFGKIAVSTKFPDNIGMSQDGTKEIQNLFGIKAFSFPKPSSLLKFLISICNIDEGLVLDFFSGSATTADAIFSVNKERQSNIKFILVQLPEEVESSDIDFSNICEIGKERIRRAGKKIKSDSPLTTQHLDTGFRVLKLADSNMKQVYYTPTDTKLQMERTLFDTASNIKDDRTDLDLLFQIMLEKDITLDAPIRKEEIQGHDVYFVDDTYLVAAFGENLPEELIMELAKMQPFNFVMANRGLADDSMADNFEQIFKAYSPDTNCMIL